MPITHPSMSRVKDATTEAPKQEVHVVDNMEPVIPDHILNATPRPAPVVPPAPKPTPKHTNMLEELLFLGRAIKQVTIESMVFEMSTLTQKETSELMKYIYSDSIDASNLFAIKVLTLAYAVRSVNNVNLEDIEVDEDTYDSVVAKKMDILENMQKHVVEKLHAEYLDLVASSEKALTDDEVKEELKNS